VHVPEGDEVLGSAWLGNLLEASRDWPHGSIWVGASTLIGTEHGMSGRIHRVAAETERGGSMTLVVKQEKASAVERELLFRRECGELIKDCTPDCFAGVSDSATDRGVLVHEDIAPAEQGDVLRRCSPARAETAVRALARVHSASWKPSDDHYEALPRWAAQPMESDAWIDPLARAGERFPQVLPAAIASQIHDLPEKVGIAVAKLREGPASWIQVDAHLDNVLWRTDGTAVLLDWCTAAVGPPTVDLARFLSEGIAAESRSTLISAYVDELQTSGVDRELMDVGASVEDALLPLLQAAVGWAGREDLALEGRAADVCERWLRSICGWAIANDSGSHVGTSGS
jgi:hypothetical protein